MRRRGQTGVTLLEVALAVMLIGIALLSVVGVLYAVMISSATHQDKVRVGNRATELAEKIDDMIYIPCDGADLGALYQSATDVGSDAPYWEEIVDVRYLADAGQAAPAWNDSCPANDQGAQEITVSVGSKSRRMITTELVFVKRDTTCPEGIVGRKC
ncbi:MAG: hypothetical protein M9922_13775 [Microthrixaceae bacterium]|nr:hypothetical protein [Microthrixaceae bacterium]